MLQHADILTTVSSVSEEDSSSCIQKKKQWEHVPVCTLQSCKYFYFTIYLCLISCMQWLKYCFFIFSPRRIQFFHNALKAIHDLDPCFLSDILVPHGSVRTLISSGRGLLSFVGWKGKSTEYLQSRPWGLGRICRDQVSWVIDLF